MKILILLILNIAICDKAAAPTVELIDSVPMGLTVAKRGQQDSVVPSDWASGNNKLAVMQAISQVESCGGKNMNHKVITTGLNIGSHAWGAYGLTPTTIKETISKNPKFKSIAHAASLLDEQLGRFVMSQKGLDEAIASAHYDRLQRYFGGNLEAISRAWLCGIQSTKKTLNNNQNIRDHWYVKRVKKAFQDILSNQLKDNKNNNL